MSTLYLHVGMPKAGSTSIQEAFDAHRPALLAAGINYLDLGPSHSKVFLALFGAKKLKLRTRVTRHMGAEESLEDYDLADLERILLQQLTGTAAAVTIASGEMMFRFDGAQCRELRDFVAPHFDDVRIIVYVREPIGLANSRAQQNVKGGREPISAMADPRAIARGKSALLPRYRAQIETWMEAFGRDAVIIREFDRRAFVGGDLVTDFADLVGVPEALRAGMAGGWTKVSQSAEAVLILDRYLERTRPGKRPAFGPLRDLVWDMPGTAFSLPRPVLEEVWRASTADVDWLRQVTGRPLFATAGPGRIRAEDPWPAESMAALEAMLGASVVPLRGLEGDARRRALDDLCDRLVARVAGRKIRAKYTRGRASRLLAAAAALASRLGRRLSRLLGKGRAGASSRRGGGSETNPRKS